MFDFRVNGIIAGAAFLLSFLIGLVSGSSMPMLLAKPAIFAVLFFVLSGLVKTLASRFLPELTEENPDEGLGPFTGSRVNIMEGEGAAGFDSYSQASQSAGARPDDSGGELGDISNLSRAVVPELNAASLREEAAGMDQNAEADYTDEGKIEDVSPPGMESFFDSIAPAPSPARQTESRPSGENNAGTGRRGAEPVFGSDDFLPDLDSMAGAFVSASSREESEASDYSIPSPLKRPSSGRAREQEWAGDFNAKDLAAGLRTVLNKEKEG